MSRPLATLGVDCGNYTLRAVSCRDGLTEELEDQDGYRLTPAAIAFDGAWKFGSEAGESAAAVWKAKSHLTDKDWVEGRSLNMSASQALQAALQRCVGSWRDKVKPAAIEMTGVVVPVSFSQAERETFRRLAEQAGLLPVVLIHEPDAAVLGARTPEGEWLTSLLGDDEETVLIVDVAGDRTTASMLTAVRRRDHLRLALVAQRSVEVGAEQVLQRLGEALCQRARSEQGHLGWLQLARMEAKSIGRSEKPVKVIFPSPLGGGEVEIGAHDWEQSAAIELRQIAVVAGDCMQAAARVMHGQSPSRRETRSRGRRQRCIAVGGGWRLAPIAKQLNYLSPEAEGDFAEASFVLARGAARYATLHCGMDREFEYRALQRPAVGVELADGRFDLILPPDWEVGDQGVRVYTNAEDLPSAIRFRFGEGFALEAISGKFIEEREVPVGAELRGSMQLTVQMKSISYQRIDTEVEDRRSSKQLLQLSLQV